MGVIIPRSNTQIVVGTKTISPDAVWNPSQVGFSPSEPLSPQAPKETPRRMDYLVGRNLLVTPRAAEGRAVTYGQMRSIADMDSILRTIIEKRKDEMKGLEWDISLRPEFQGDFTHEILAAKKFWQKPDLETPFDQWMGALLEDVFVVDAPVLFKERDRIGRFRSLQIIDGTTFVVYVDDRGRVPNPPQEAYAQVIKGMPRTSYIRPVQGENTHRYRLSTDYPDNIPDALMNELYYRPYNLRSQGVYGFSYVESIIMTVNIALRRTTSFLEWFRSGNLPQALKDAPDTWTPDQIDQFQAMFDTRMSGDLSARSGLHFVPGGGGAYTPIQQLQFDAVFDEWLARIYCARFGVSPAPYVRMMNRATAESIEEASTEESLVPMMQYLKNWFDDVMANCLQLPMLEFTWKQGWQYTPEQQNSDVTLVEHGLMTPDKMLAQRGEPPLPNGLGAKHYVWVNGAPMLFEDALAGANQPAPPNPQNDNLPRLSIGKEEPETESEDANPYELSIKAVKGELDAWEKFALNRLGKKNSRPFATKCLPKDFAEVVVSGLAEANTPESVKAVFDTVRQNLTRRRTPQVEGSLNSLLKEYESELKKAISEAKQNG